MKRKCEFLSVIALMVALAMLLTGCTTGSGVADPSSSAASSEPSSSSQSTSEPDCWGDDDPNHSDPGTEPIWTGEGIPTITILMQKADHVTSYIENSYTKKLEQDGNVHLAFEWLPPSEAQLALRMRLLSGGTLPMVVNYGLTQKAAYEYGESGYFTNLAPYIDSGIAIYTLENDWNFPELYLLDSLRAVDGSADKIYGFPKLMGHTMEQTMPYKLWINVEWLERLGVVREEIRTTEDFYNVLMRFKNEDANGDGNTNDEIPFLPVTSFGGTAYKFLTNAFVFEGGGDLLMFRDGQVTASYLQDEWYQAADYIRTLVNDGLLSKEGFTMDQNGLKSLLSQRAAKNGGRSMVGATTRSTIEMMKVNSTLDFRLQYAAIDPLKASEEQQEIYASYTLPVVTSQWHVTTAAGAYEKLCVRLGDVQQQASYHIQNRYGDEDTNWLKSEDYLKKLPDWEKVKETAKNEYGIPDLQKEDLQLVAPYETMGISGEYVWFNDVWSDENAFTWYDDAPTFCAYIDWQGEKLWHTFNFEVSPAYRNAEANAVQHRLMRASSAVCPTLCLTPKEEAELGGAPAAIRKFVEQQRIAYYKGQTSVLAEGKDAFITELNKLGMEQMLRIYNTAYQRQYERK